MATSIEHSSPVLRPRPGARGRVYWDAQWRYRTAPENAWQLKKQRLGLAWLEPDGQGGWRKRKGRCPEGWLDERAATLAADAATRAHADGVAAAERDDERRRTRPVSVREIAHEWLAWLEEVRGAKPSTLRDYRTTLREAGEAYRRGKGASAGRIMAAFGDRAACELTTADVTRFLRSLDAQGLTPRNVNKHRQMLHAIFEFARRADTFALPANPVEGTDKRREPPPAALDYYEVEEVEALARVCERGGHRREVVLDPEELEARRAEDHRDADAFRLLFYTGIRLGELLALRWADVDLASRLLLVRRTVSAGEETIPKGRRQRLVPLADPAMEALARLGARDEFVGPDDYVLSNRWGRRLDGSALRRRYKAACEVAGLRPVKLHGLRHAAGSIVARTTDAVFVRDYLGHAKLSTTDRYVGAKFRPEDFERLNRAYGAGPVERVEAAPDAAK